MNADGKALFAAICADPEDDTSRLVRLANSWDK